MSGNAILCISTMVLLCFSCTTPSHFLDETRSRTAYLDRQLTRQTEKYLAKFARREARMKKKLSGADSSAASSLFAASDGKYAALSQKLTSDTGGAGIHLSGEYQPYTDSLQGMLKFLQADPAALNVNSTQLQSSLRQLQIFQAKMQDADQVKAYIRERKQQLEQYLSQHAGLQNIMGRDLQGMNQDIYYYSQQVRQYKELLNDPDKLTKEALAVLNKLPAFQSFMKQNSQLGALFSLPGNYSDPGNVAGLQTRDQVAALINQQVAAAGPGGQAALQSSLQSAGSQLDGYKDKLNKLGGGSGDMDKPDFKPNEQKTKTFWRRLEYGTNFQTTRNNYAFPTVSDLGLSVGYKLSNRSTVGVGASYKLGWGNGIQHIAFSSQGAGLRSFLDVQIKGSFSATGGFEYNYTVPFSSYQQLREWDSWTKSGLIGVTKTVSMKSRVFKKTKLQLLWDFLSYQQMPQTQPLLFRIAYNF